MTDEILQLDIIHIYCTQNEYLYRHINSIKILCSFSKPRSSQSRAYALFMTMEVLC